MKRLIVIFIISVLALACGSKKFEAGNNNSVKLLGLLNKGNNEQVIDILSKKASLSDDERYYLASAYASLGGVDLYSLFDLLQVELFHREAFRWSSLEEDSNSSGRILQGRIKTSDKKSNPEQRLERWQAVKERMMVRYNTSETYNCMQFNELSLLCQEVNEKLFTYIESNLDQTDYWGFIKGFSADLTAEDLDKLGVQEMIDELKSYNKNVFEYLHAKNDYVKNGVKFKENKGSLLFPIMNIIWMTYKTLPILESLPIINPENQKNLTKSIRYLGELASSSEYGARASSFIMSLSFFSLMSIYSNSFDIMNASSPEDLFCSFDPKNLTKHYDLLRRRLSSIAEAQEKSFLSDEQKVMISEYVSTLNDMPEQLDVEKQNAVIGLFRDYQVKNCSLESLL